MRPSAASARLPWRSLVAVIASMAVTSLIYGLTFPLLALELARQGVSETMIGLNAACQGVAVFAVLPVLGRLTRGLRLDRLMLGGVGASLTLFLLLPAAPYLEAWFVLRFLLGLANSLLWISGEAWINAAVDERLRGRVIGVYSMALAAGFALGPMLLAQTGTEGWTPFLAAAALITASGAPVLLARASAPTLENHSPIRISALVWLAPTAMLANLTLAAADAAMLTFFPIYSIDLGLTEARALYLISAMGVGGIVFQPLIGWLADVVDRALLIALGALLMALAGLAMPAMLTAETWSWLMMFAVGGVLGGFYTVGLVMIGNRFTGAQLAGATAVFTSMWSLGGMIGLPIAGGAMEIAAPHGLPAAIIVIFLALLPIAAVEFARRRRRRAQTAAR